MKDRDCGRRVHHGFGPTLCLMMTLTLILEVGTLFAADNRGERYEKGYRALQALNADGAGKVIEGLRDIAPEMSDFLIEFAYGDVFTRPALDPKSREMATIAALTALGNAAPQLKWHIAAALNIGVRPEQIIEIMYVSVVYHGFPAALNVIAAAREVFAEKGIRFTPVKREKIADKRALGLKAMDATSRGAGEKVVDSLKDIAPEMADFILEFSYADIFSRGVLSPGETELVAIAGMCASGTQRPQLIVHIKSGLNVGLTKEQIIEVMDQMAVYAGFPAALNGISAAREAFASAAR
ncbi:MAG TPA: carboxymuconolactone decarboxylase family protein [Syntrophobacter fumaroxidans]|nr:carboxymuconolactone decarboxylase family protein [Syntrophobacter fumaroxidans]